MSNTFYSHGKLLITGEYFVLEGSTAFALPLKLGQSMEVNTLNSERVEIVWESYCKGELCFKSVFNPCTLDPISTYDIKKASYIHKLLMTISKKSDVLQNLSQSILIKTNLDFPFEWGFGSSSSLISNLAHWAEIDPFELFFENFKGSGYDIACARANGPILYKLDGNPKVTEIDFNPGFLDKIYFIYLGKKQDSLKSVEKYGEKIREREAEKARISDISQSIIRAKTLEEFEYMVNEHDSILSQTLKLPTVKSKLFSNFAGTIKSLGAWGGDFVMATSKGYKEEVVKYFKSKGLNTIFQYKDIVL